MSRYANGRLPRRVLRRIPMPGPTVYLELYASRAWRAMARYSKRRYGISLYPAGTRSAYRTYAQQVYFWRLYLSGRGNLAARPGTSNHGWGRAVDLAHPRMRRVTDRIGMRFGWWKPWSDAPGEWWHLRYRPGVWKPAKRRRTSRKRKR